MSKIIISPSQAILIMINIYAHDRVLLEKLKILYLLGINTPSDKQLFEKILLNPIFKKYTVKKDAQTINNDPTRRYFETHLAYETLEFNLKKLNSNNLNLYYINLKKEIEETSPHYISFEVKKLSNGIPNRIDKEFTYAIKRLKNNRLFPHRSEESKNKISLLIQITVLSVLNASYNYKPLPLNIYNSGIFLENNRGRIIKEEHPSTCNSSFGLFRGEMPIMIDDPISARAIFPHLKASDKSDYILKSEWAQDSFSKLVHPHSNSISGTILCILRTLAALNKIYNSKENPLTASTHTIKTLLTHCIAIQLFITGGHSLYEYTAVFSLPKIQEYFAENGKYNFKEINLRSMFYTDNEQAFNKALVDTIKYNKYIMKKQAVNLAILETPPVNINAITELEKQRTKITTQNLNLSLEHEKNIQNELQNKITNFQEIKHEAINLLINGYKQFHQKNQSFLFYSNVDNAVSEQMKEIRNLVIQNKFSPALEYAEQLRKIIIYSGKDATGTRLKLLNTIIDDIQQLNDLLEKIEILEITIQNFTLIPPNNNMSNS